MEVKCPYCDKVTEWENNSFRPFCSETCKKRDLGKWVTERYRITTEDGANPDDKDEENS